MMSSNFWCIVGYKWASHWLHSSRQLHVIVNNLKLSQMIRVKSVHVNRNIPIPIVVCTEKGEGVIQHATRFYEFCSMPYKNSPDHIDHVLCFLNPSIEQFHDVGIHLNPPIVGNKFVRLLYEALVSTLESIVHLYTPALMLYGSWHSCIRKQ